MAFQYQPDTSVAEWVVRSGTPDIQLILFGPAVYDGYARLRFIPDPDEPGQREADVRLPYDHPAEIEQTRRALRTLSRFTSTPEDCYFCLWDGYSDVNLPPQAPGDGLFTLPYRRYAIVRGAVADLAEWEATFGSGGPIAPPAFVWPADHSWCFASDVDPHWAGIGATPAAVDALVDDPEIDVVRAQPAETQPTYR
ncbi:hypothetical protein GCM10022222_16180 [Amycolatopsis ultiminotia]|uniref:Uncharacterized protein n=1 Tax=Amycolatopsis ultiminotia TaxID=543629 RepID=A0ABP6VEJ9_9PSEU